MWRQDQDRIEMEEERASMMQSRTLQREQTDTDQTGLLDSSFSLLDGHESVDLRECDLVSGIVSAAVDAHVHVSELGLAQDMLERGEDVRLRLKAVKQVAGRVPIPTQDTVSGGFIRSHQALDQCLQHGVDA